MRLVMVVFTALALSLGACHIEGPRAGEAKYTPKAPETKRLGVLLAGADKEGYEDQLFAYMIDTHTKKVSLRAIEALPGQYDSLGGANDCVDHYEGAESSDDEDNRTIYSKRKGRKSVEITIRDKKKHPKFDEHGEEHINDLDHNNEEYMPEEDFPGEAKTHAIVHFEYTVIDSAGNPVTYKYIPVKRFDGTQQGHPMPHVEYDYHNGLLIKSQFFDDEKDCDHVSQSGEEGSVAPGGG